MTDPTPVHSMMASGSTGTSRRLPGVVGRPEGADEVGLQAGLGAVENVDLFPLQLRPAGREETDRARTGHEDGLRLPEGALADEDDLLERLRDHGHRLEEDAEEAEGRVHLHGVLGLDAPPLGHVAVDLLDPPFGVLAVPAHVPLPDRAGGAGDTVRAPDDADDEIALLQPAGQARVQDAAEGLVTEDEARLPGGSPAVLALRRSRRPSRRRRRRWPPRGPSRRGRRARERLRGGRTRASEARR